MVFEVLARARCVKDSCSELIVVLNINQH